MPRIARLLAVLPLLATSVAQQRGFVPPDQQEPAAEALQTVVFSARIIDTEGRPIEGAGLALFTADDAKDNGRCLTAPAAKSGADGKLTLTVKRSASDRRTWLLAASKRTSLVLRVLPTKTSVDGEEIHRADLGDVLMHEGVSILGLVRDQDGKPVAGAEVIASDILGQVLVNRNVRVAHSTICYGVSDAHGRVRLVGIPAHGVSVKVEARGYFGWRTDYLSRHTPLVVTLQAGGQVSGTLLSPDGKPLEGARIYVHSEASSQGPSHVTKGDGRFTLQLPGEGRYRLRYYAKLAGASSYTYEYTKVMSAPQQDLELRFGTGAMDSSGNPIAEALKAAAGKNGGVEAADAGKVTLRIVDAETGIALREARAAAFWWQPTNWQHNPGYLERQLDNKKDEQLDERGHLRLPGPRQGQPDTGRIIVAAKGYAPHIITDVDWDANGKNERKVEMHKESVVTGVVVDPKTGAPLPGVDVITVTDPAMLRHYSPQPVRRKLDGISGVVKTDDKGAFRIGELTDGDLQIYVAHPQRADIPPIPVKLQTAATVEGLRIEYPKGGSLHGKLTGAPVKAGWRVRISRMPEPRNHFGSTYGLSDDQRYESVPVAADGSFSFHGLSRANYLLSLSMPYPHGALEIGIEPIRMRSSDVERSFDISEDLPGRLKGRVKVEGGTFTPGRLMLIATDATRTNMNYSYSGRPNLQGDFALLDGRGEFDLPVSEGQYYLSVVDLMTRLTLLQGTTAVSVRATQTTPHDLLVAVAPVTVELQPERDGIKIGITRIEIRADHPKPAQGRNFGIVMGQQNHDSGVGLLVRPGTTEVQLILPIVPCKLLARSDAHNLDPKVHQYNFPAQGEVELTPKPGQSNKIELTVGEPQIDILGEAKAAGEGAKAGAAKARAAKTIEVKRR